MAGYIGKGKAQSLTDVPDVINHDVDVTGVVTTDGLISSGNVGIGTSSPETKMHVSIPYTQAMVDASTVVNALTLEGIEYDSPNMTGVENIGLMYKLPTNVNTSYDAARIYAKRNSASDTVNESHLVFEVNTNGDTSETLTEAMRIDSSGNVGIGTSSPAFGTGAGIVIDKTISTISLQNGTGSSQAFELVKAGDDGYLINRDVGNLRLYTNNTERMRIDSSGRLLVGTTSYSGNNPYISLPFGGGRHGMSFKSSDTSSYYAQSFYSSSGSLIGSVYCTTSSTAYNTSSDYRLKEDWKPMTDASSRVAQLKPVNFAWKADGKRVDGFLAHELAEVIPEAVTGTKDAMRTEEYEVSPAVLDDEGNVVTEAVIGTREVPDYQGIDQSKLVPLLTAALQEALTRIETLETKVATLEGAS